MDRRELMRAIAVATGLSLATIAAAQSTPEVLNCKTLGDGQSGDTAGADGASSPAECLPIEPYFG